MNKEKILIIEDDQTFALYLSDHLNSEYSVKTANNYAEAEVTLEERWPDFVILDYFLPDKNGDEIFETIRGKWPGVKVVILSANESSKTVIKLIRLGVSDYVMKDEKAVREIKNILKDK